jgi:hypothetical protein
LDITILIGKKKESTDLTFSSLRLYHKECKGGSIETRREGKVINSDLVFCCRRCHAECKIVKEEEINIKSEMVKTSVEGKARKITVEKDGNKEYSVSLIPRDPSSDEITTIPEDQTLSLDFSDE